MEMCLDWDENVWVWWDVDAQGLAMKTKQSLAYLEK
jgi:hypothetical protein